jgi:ATP-dependent Clp endopeptidase proteolytic subunit ClpP
VPRQRRTRLGNVINGPSAPAGKTWYRFQDASSNVDDDVTDLYIYDEIGGWGIYSTDLIRTLMQVTSDTINVRINSPGGDVFEGLAIHNALVTHPATVNTYVDGLAASAASVVFQAGKNRKVSKYSTVMVHNPSAGVWGEATDLRKMADLLDKLRDTLAKLYADRSGDEIEQWVAAMAAETWYNAEEAVEFNLADEIDAAAGEPQNTWDLAKVYAYAGRNEAPAPVRFKAVAIAPVVPPKQQSDPVPPPPEPEPEPVDEPTQGEFVFDPDVFRAAVSFAAEPPVATDVAPFEFDPTIFKAIMEDRTRTAPAVALDSTPAEPPSFDSLYDPALMRQAVLEGLSK